MMTVACQVACVLGAKHKQRVEIGVVERVLGALQALAQHALRIKAHFPINRNHSDIGHELFSSEIKSGNPLISSGSGMSNQVGQPLLAVLFGPAGTIGDSQEWLSYKNRSSVRKQAHRKKSWRRI